MRGFAIFLLWCLLLILSWPLALLAVIMYPVVWVLMLPFRVVGMSVEAVLAMLRGVLFLPARALGVKRA